MDKNNIENIFSYHAPTQGKIPLFEMLRKEAKELALLINMSSPDCYEKSIAINRLEEVIMWANAAIARNKIQPATSYACCNCCGRPRILTKNQGIADGENKTVEFDMGDSKPKVKVIEVDAEDLFGKSGLFSALSSIFGDKDKSKKGGD